ncbi:hypothetical protein DFP96_101380 [Listeria rocourtiae]|uniref:Uncharacterized protein n=1 Tax=Listeria rocourtiae TaxID=647910 RepID=A0A4R6ZT80_9LIST|nr:hypothetical protein DFP96_101380 [Listeria rocourtiae]
MRPENENKQESLYAPFPYMALYKDPYFIFPSLPTYFLVLFQAFSYFTFSKNLKDTSSLFGL